MRRILTVVCLLLSGLVELPAAETLVLVGTVTNTTHDVSAPLQFELEWGEDDAEGVTGFMTVEAPLTAGRWPVTGRRRGAWVELHAEQIEGTRTILRGVLDDQGRLVGTFHFGGGGYMVQFGRFQAKVVAERPKK